MAFIEEKEVEAVWLDPEYVQVTRKEAARILAVSMTELNRLRATDPECPKGFRNHDGRGAKIRFRLADIYRYSAYRISTSEEPGTREGPTF